MFQSAQHVSGNFFAHPQERKTVFYSMWYNEPKLLPAGLVSASTFQATGRQQLGCTIPHAVKHVLAPLRMGKKIARNMLS
jgi:hypothetical protein